MKFEHRHTADCLGWQLAHSVPAGGRRFAKGHKLTAANIGALEEAGHKRLTVFKLQAGDVDENTAAAQLAAHVAGPGLVPGAALHGRTDIQADMDGVLIVGRGVEAVNRLDEALTIATLPDHSAVRAGQTVATVKIIPYSVAGATLKSAILLPLQQLVVKAFRPYRAALIVSGDQGLGKILPVTEARLARTRGTLGAPRLAAHTVEALTAAFQEIAAQDIDIILVFGISAISDRRDTVPAALIAAGGQVLRLGMPADPGNLLMLGKIRGKTVIGLPGCAKSPAVNGLDFVLERFAAGLELSAGSLAAMGAGGFLKGAPRREALEKPSEISAHAIVLAAGRSRRAGGANKLLSLLGDSPVIRHTVATAAAATGALPLVVLGHDVAKFGEALAGIPLEKLENPDHASGMASSLRLGLQALPASASHVFVCLGDMPFVRPETFRQLIDFSTESEAGILIPTFHGKRGNPVLWRTSLLPALMAIEGDRGGRDIIHAHPELVAEVPVDDPGILIDLDTPEALNSFGIKAVMP